jgi:excisionase family DNA binding protein
MTSSRPPKTHSSRTSARDNSREPIYLASQLASICDVDLKTIHNWCARNDDPSEPAGLESFRTAGGHLRFHHAAVLRFLTRWGYPIPNELLRDRPHVQLVEADPVEREALIARLGLTRPGGEQNQTSLVRATRDTLGLWASTNYYLHLWDDAYAALVSLGERAGAGSPPDIAVLSLPLVGIDAHVWIDAARTHMGDDTMLFVAVVPDISKGPVRGATTLSRHRVDDLGELLGREAQALQARVDQRDAQVRAGAPRRRIPIAPRESIYVASQVASIWNVDLKTVHNWVERGDMEAFRTPGRHLRFRRRSLLSFLRRYNMEVPADLAPARPTVMVVDTDPAHAHTIFESLSRFEIIASDDPIRALAEIGTRSAGANHIDAVVVCLPVTNIDSERWLSALSRHPDTRYTRIITIGGDATAQQRWRELGVAATVDASKLEHVAPVIEQMLGLTRC